MTVRVVDLAPHTDARGASFRIDVPFPAVGECHVATIRPGGVRGNHFHTERHELLVVLYTDRWTLLWDAGENTPVQSRTFSGSGAVLMEAGPLAAHAVRNDGSADLQIFVLGDVRNDETRRRELTPPLRKLAGIDGCRAGWVAVVEDGDAIEMRVLHSEDELLGLMSQCLVVGIDIPIGLTDSGPRACDRHARRHLGRRASSVFPAPLRPLLALRDYVEANRISRELQKRGISKQGWAIVPKVAQIDRLLQRHHELRGRVYEVHPEVSFAAWNREPLAASKHQSEGRAVRRKLVTETFGALPPVPRGASEDDVLDAFAALWTARRIARNEHDVLGDGHADVTGLPMRIVY
jgi:predicted RNase H-like nuclease